LYILLMGSRDGLKYQQRYQQNCFISWYLLAS